MEEQNKIEIIKEKYSRLDHKGEAIKIIAEDRGLKESSVRQNWIKLWQIPNKELDRLIELLDKILVIEKKCRDDKQNLIN